MTIAARTVLGSKCVVCLGPARTKASLVTCPRRLQTISLIIKSSSPMILLYVNRPRLRSPSHVKKSRKRLFQ